MQINLNAAVTTDTGATAGTIIDMGIETDPAIKAAGGLMNLLVTLPGQSPVAISLSKSKLSALIQNGARFQSIESLIT